MNISDIYHAINTNASWKIERAWIATHGSDYLKNLFLYKDKFNYVPIFHKELNELVFNSKFEIAFNFSPQEAHTIVYQKIIPDELLLNKYIEIKELYPIDLYIFEFNEKNVIGFYFDTSIFYLSNDDETNSN